MTNQDERLKGNEKIETAIAALQQEPSDELLAHTLTIIRRRMKEQGQLSWQLNLPLLEPRSMYRP